MSDYTEHLISMAGGDGEPDALDLNAIQARVDAATEGPWHAGRGATSDGKEFARTYEQKKAFLALSLNEGESELWLVDNGEVIPAATGDGPKARANAEFTAHARTDVPALLALVREQAAQIERVKAIHKLINVYDECECTDGTHPEEYEWIDREDYNGCENSFSHYACESCCTANDYITEWCSDTHDHSTDTGNQCPTIAALTATEDPA